MPHGHELERTIHGVPVIFLWIYVLVKLLPKISDPSKLKNPPIWSYTSLYKFSLQSSLAYTLANTRGWRTVYQRQLLMTYSDKIPYKYMTEMFIRNGRLLVRRLRLYLGREVKRRYLRCISQCQRYIKEHYQIAYLIWYRTRRIKNSRLFQKKGQV